jgi:hypothetical protein
LGGDQDGAGGQDGAFDVLAADAQEVGVGDAVGLVDDAGVAAFAQGALWQGGGGGLAAISLRTWPVTEVSGRAYFSVATRVMPRGWAALVNSASQPSP